MSKTIEDHFTDASEFETVLEAAEKEVSTENAAGFVKDMKERYGQWGADLYLSDKQVAWLKQIAGGQRDGKSEGSSKG